MAIARHRSHRSTALLRCAFAIILPFALLTMHAPAQVMAEHHTLRQLSGTVTDGHEPIRGAIVQLQAEGSTEVLTYVTEDNGRYQFKRLIGEQDYRVWVVFRKRHSKAKEISKFDENLKKTIDFQIAPF